MTEHTSNSKHSSEEDQIDIIALAKNILEGRKIIIKSTLIFMAFGLFIAIFSPKEYTASTTIVPAAQGKSIGGNLGGLAAMAGINLGNMISESGISPALYPQITFSIPFQKELLQTPLTFEGQKAPITYEDYYTNYNSLGLSASLKKYTIGLPGLLIKALKGKPALINALDSDQVEGSKIQTITEEENILIEQLNDQLSLDINDKDGYVTLAVIMPEAFAAAEMAQNAQKLLQQYIINFKVQKSSEQLKFIKDRYAEKEVVFKSTQQQLARFQDRNQFVNSALAKMNLMRLQADYDLAYGVYSELSKQLETQKIQVKEDTPVFTVLKPVTIPIEKSGPKRILIIFLYSFLGAVLSIGFVLSKDPVQEIIKEIKSKKEK
jgi:LPS O-antigen subunit length determinant protein (WzzB/FepE family)